MCIRWWIECGLWLLNGKTDSMNILITGIHGFVGTNLVDALASEHTIYGLDIVAPEKKGVAKTFSWEDMDSE